MTAAKTLRSANFDPQRQRIHQGIVYELGEERVDGPTLTAAWRRIGILAAREVQREHAWDARTYEHVIQLDP